MNHRLKQPSNPITTRNMAQLCLLFRRENHRNPQRSALHFQSSATPAVAAAAPSPSGSPSSTSTTSIDTTSTGSELTPVSSTEEEQPKLVLVPGRSPEGVPIVNSLRPSSKSFSKVIIGVRGSWYDVTSFVPHHPGGDVILEFAGKDATAQFMAYHSPSVLQHRKPVGKYDFSPSAPGGEKMQGDWMALVDRYEREGKFKTPPVFVASRFAILGAFLMGTLTCTWLYKYLSEGSTKAFSGPWYSWVVLILGAVCLAGFWQQSGFLMHDTQHNLLFHDRNRDQPIGWLCGNVFLGLSSKWWRDEHNEHHLFTNTAVTGIGPSDPQMFEDVWIQDPMLVPFFWRPAVKFIVKFQRYYFIPICMFAGPYAIKVASLVKERRPMQIIGMALHWVWVSTLISCFPTLQEGLFFYGIAMLFLGILTIQLLVSHYSKPWAEKDTVKAPGSWAQRQVESVVDISCPTYLDWFHGGLHLHSPHHLFPRLPRCYYREAQLDVIQMCQKNNVTLDVMPWFTAIAATVRHLGSIGDQLGKQHED